MIESATGVVLRTHRLTETSLIVRWLTPDLGRIATVAKGARRPQSPFAGKLDLFYEADFSFSRSRRSELHTLREVELREVHPALRQEVGRLQQAAYGAALIEQTTEVETPLPGVFRLFRALLDHLAAHAPRPRLVFAFELRLLDELGLAPALADTRLSPPARELAGALAAADWPSLEGLAPQPKAVRELGAFLHGFLIYHLGRLPGGRGDALRADAG